MLHFSWKEKYVTRLNLLISHFLVKVGFLDNKLFSTFEGSNEVNFGWSSTCFKAMEVSYNFPTNSLLQKTHELFLIPKIPLKGQNYQKWPSCMFSFQTPSTLSWNHKNFRVWFFMLKIHQRFKKCNLLFLVWNDHFTFSVVFAHFLFFVHI